MADGLGAMDAGSAAEWQPVACAAETRCASFRPEHDEKHVESKRGEAKSL